MRVKVNKFLLDKIIIIIMLFYVLIDIWLGFYTNTIEVLITLLCVISILISIKKIKPAKRQGLLVFTLIVALYLIVNYMFASTNMFFFTNLTYVIKCIVVAIFWGCVLSSNSVALEEFLVKISKYLNVYMVLNIAIMFLQLNESYFLIDKSRIPSVVYYPDYIAGLFGINGTHRLTLFSIFLLCFDLYIYKNRRIKNYKRLKIFIIVVSISLLFLSTQNDNNTFIIIFPIFMGLTYCALYVINLNRILKIIGIVFVVLIGGSIEIANNPVWFSEISSRLGDIFSVYILRDVLIWDERKKLLAISLSQGNGYLFGSGLGSVKMYSDLRLGSHWGMNSLMTFVYFMGIGPLLIYIWLLFNSILSIKTRFQDKELLFIKICLYIATFLLVQYCQLLSEINLMILYGMIMSVFSFSISTKYLE